MKVVRLSAPRTGRLYPQEISLVLIFIRGWVSPKATVRQEGLCQWQTPVAPSGIALATFRFVAQSLNQIWHHVKHGNSFTVVSRVCRTLGEVSLNSPVRFGRSVTQVRLTFIDVAKRTKASAAATLTKLAITQRHYCNVFHWIIWFVISVVSL